MTFEGADTLRCHPGNCGVIVRDLSLSIEDLLKINHKQKIRKTRESYFNHLKNYFVYILTNKNHTVFYIGVTSNIQKRVAQHRLGIACRFTNQYQVKKLVYLEFTNDVKQAILREKKLKKWKKAWKVQLINEFNPEWKDLYEGMVGF